MDTTAIFEPEPLAVALVQRAGSWRQVAQRAFYCLPGCAGTQAWLFTPQGPVEVSPRLFERADGTLDLEAPNPKMFRP